MRYGPRYYRSVWSQRRHVKAWERHGRCPVHTLAVRGRNRGRGLNTVEIEDPEILELERACEHVSRGEDTSDVLEQLAELFERVADAPLTFKQLDVLRRALSAALQRPDRKRLAASLDRMLGAGELNATVRPFVASFLAIFKASGSTRVTTVLALARPRTPSAGVPGGEDRAVDRPLLRQPVEPVAADRGRRSPARRHVGALGDGRAGEVRGPARPRAGAVLECSGAEGEGQRLGQRRIHSSRIGACRERWRRLCDLHGRQARRRSGPGRLASRARRSARVSGIGGFTLS